MLASILHTRAKGARFAALIVCKGRSKNGIRSVFSLMFFAIKKLPNIMRKSRGNLMVEKMTSCLFINEKVY